MFALVNEDIQATIAKLVRYFFVKLFVVLALAVKMIFSYYLIIFILTL